MCRGLRYTNYTDIRPYTTRWAWTAEEPKARQNLINSFAPVALFDKEYDDLGIDPLMKEEYPPVDAGAVLERTLVLYNDECRDTSVTAEVEICAGGTTSARGQKTIQLALGEHVDIPCSFQVPHVKEAEMEMVLRTYKGGVKKFEEAKRFGLQPSDRSGDYLHAVTLGEPAG